MFFKSSRQRAEDLQGQQEQEAARRAAEEAAKAIYRAQQQARAEEAERRAAQCDALGYKGTAADVFTMANSLDEDETDQEHVLAGAIRAFEEGRPENLQQFFSGYLARKSADGYLEELEQNELDEDIDTVVLKTAMQLIEKSDQPRATIVAMAGGMAPYFAQTFLDLTLRAAVAKNNAYVADQLLDLGADVNCHEGRPFYIAYTEGHLQTAALLLKYKADTKMSYKRQIDDRYPEDFKAFVKEAAAYPLPPNITISKLFAENARQISEKKISKSKAAAPASEPEIKAAPLAKVKPPV